MHTYDIILNKRNGMENTDEELTFLINHYVQGDLPDAQMSAWLMAVYFQGLNARETTTLTTLMMHSGDVLDLSSIDSIVVDKHSTGGVGDKTTLIVAPLVASGGIPMAKLSGPGLGFTGGTTDKLKAIPGFTTELTPQGFLEQVNAIGIAVASQTGNLVPADKKIYALRDNTATIESMPLIASSIMSKKLAAGAQKIVLDVKYGLGAFMDTPEKATILAETMVKIGQDLNRQTVAVVSNMDQPLGNAIGNAVEVIEAVNALKNQAPEDLTQLCITLAGQIFHLSERTSTIEEGEALAKSLLVSGAAYEKFEQWISYQGGQISALTDPHALLLASNSLSIASTESGYICRLDAKKIGQYAMLLGAGRQSKEENIDLSAGIILARKIGDQVAVGDTLATLYFNEDHQKEAEEVAGHYMEAYCFSQVLPEKTPLILKTINN